MAYTTVNKSSLHMNTKLYTGNGGTNAITGVGFQPDFVWLKNRSATAGHQLSDAVRGKSGTNYYSLSSDTTAAQAVQGDNDGLNTLGSDGFTVGYTNSTGWNNSGNNYASWNWKANGSGSANTDGSINSTVSANTTSGFSIVKYTGTGSAGATVGHGLAVKPSMIIFKCLSVAGPSWVVYHQSKGATYTLYLDQTSAGGTSAEMLNNTEPTSSLITLGNGTSSNSSGASTIAYCFAEKTGYSKFGSYTGNGNADGTFVYTGFKPAFVMMKNASQSGKWLMMDNKRPTSGGNPNNARLFADVSNVESTTSNMIDMLSNGFKVRTSDSDHNASGDTNIYMAFAEAPLVGTNNVPCTAR